MVPARMLSSERLWLRGLCAEDRPFVFRLIADTRVRRFLGGVVAQGERAEVFARYCAMDGGEAVWLVGLKGSEKGIGLVFLSYHHDGSGHELSYQFDPEHWGKGYALEAARVVLRHALDDLGMAQIIAETQSANGASCRLLERLGMREQRRLMRFGAEQIIYAS